MDWKELEFVENQEFTMRTPPPQKKERDSVKRGRKRWRVGYCALLWEFHHSEILDVTFGSGGIILHLILSARNLEGILKTLFLLISISTRMF